MSQLRIENEEQFQEVLKRVHELNQIKDKDPYEAMQLRQCYGALDDYQRRLDAATGESPSLKSGVRCKIG